MQEPKNVEDLSRSLAATGYLAGEGLATAAHLAVALRQPLLLEGEPGTGKTALADALAQSFGIPLIRLQCYEGIDASQALYDWDFARQVLHLRSVESAGTVTSSDELEQSLYTKRFLLARPILKALQESPAVLLIDEIDRADDEFEAFLLEVLSTYQVSIPELGVVAASEPPLVVLTSNRTRELHDALKRRCLYHWIDHPEPAREIDIVRIRLPEVSERLISQVVEAVSCLRADGELFKAPGVAETLDWVRALDRLGREHLDLRSARLTIGSVCKHHEDAKRASTLLETMVGA